MPRESGQKLKILYLYKILMEQSDESHPLSVPALVDALREYGITAERKSIYNDLDALEQFGADVAHDTKGWYLASREFDLPELQLLANAVASSKFITEKKSQELIRKITGLTGKYDAVRLNRQIYILNRRKHVNEQIYYNVDRIHDAISENREIRFHYFEYDLSKSRRYRRNGEIYTALPYALCWDDDNYYMIAYYPRRDNITNFRVDRMERIELGEYREPDERRQNFSVSGHTQGLFSMFGGEKMLAQIEFRKYLIGAVLDRFGLDVALKPVGDDRFVISADIVVSPAFWGWLFQFGADAKVVGPESLCRLAAEETAKLAALYAPDAPAHLPRSDFSEKF